MEALQAAASAIFRRFNEVQQSQVGANFSSEEHAAICAHIQTSHMHAHIEN